MLVVVYAAGRKWGAAGAPGRIAWVRIDVNLWSVFAVFYGLLCASVPSKVWSFMYLGMHAFVVLQDMHQCFDAKANLIVGPVVSVGSTQLNALSVLSSLRELCVS